MMGGLHACSLSYRSQVQMTTSPLSTNLLILGISFKWLSVLGFFHLVCF